MQGHYNLIFPGGGARDGKAVRRGQHCHDALQCPRGRTALEDSLGETSKRLEEDDYARLKYDATAMQDAVIIGRVAELAQKARRDDDGDCPGLAAHQGDRPGGGRHKAQPCGGGGKIDCAHPDAGGNTLSGRTLCASQTCGGHGTKPPRLPQRKRTSGQRETRRWKPNEKKAARETTPLFCMHFAAMVPLQKGKLK